MPAEQAWSLPLRLSQRLGGLSPARLHQDPAAVRAAIRQAPPLHRFTGDLPDWLVRAAEIILERYGGQAARLWLDQPTAMELRRRLEAFPGVSPKKAAGAVEILAADLGKPIRELSGNDVAHDAHLRRVFLRTGLARQDDVSHMVAVASGLFPGRPAAVSLAAWDIGRRWCRPQPGLSGLPDRAACARLIQAGSRIRGLPMPSGRHLAISPVISPAMSARSSALACGAAWRSMIRAPVRVALHIRGQFDGTSSAASSSPLPTAPSGQIVYKWPDQNIRKFTRCIVEPDAVAVFTSQGQVMGTLLGGPAPARRQGAPVPRACSWTGPPAATRSRPSSTSSASGTSRTSGSAAGWTRCRTRRPA